MSVKTYKARVAALGCILCRRLGYGETPAILHHPRMGQGGGERASDWLVIPLCPEHHVGKTGIHGAEFYQRLKLDEMDLLAFTIEAMEGI